MVQFGPVVLEKGFVLFFKTITNPFPLRILCLKFVYIWPSGSRKEIKNVNCLQRDGQTFFFCWLSNSSMFFVEAVILKVSLGVRFLISEVVVDSEYRGHAKGLMGNFDGDATNDFVLPNGTFLDKNATRTERNIYNNFGQKCNQLIMICLYLCLIRFINFILHHLTINEDIQSLLFKLRICLKLSSWVFFRACKRKISFSLRQGINISQLHSPWLWANILRRDG